MSDCPICNREATSESEYCEYHAEAFENVKAAFSNWERAMSIDWQEYLAALVEEEAIGKWARDVAEYLTLQDDS